MSKDITHYLVIRNERNLVTSINKVILTYMYNFTIGNWKNNHKQKEKFCLVKHPNHNETCLPTGFPNGTYKSNHSNNNNASFV